MHNNRYMQLDNRKNPMTKRKSCTTLLCEITRLKSQQKYLESNQVKLTPDNFYDAEMLLKRSDNNPKHINYINDIEHYRMQLDTELKEYRQQSRESVKHICNEIKNIREDTRHADCLDKCPIDTIRARIVDINKQIEELHSRNINELKFLQIQVQDCEKDTVILLS